MICTLTARRLKAGTYEGFRVAFEEAGTALPEIAARWTSVYVCRDVGDENVALTFGLFDGTLEELRAIQTRYRDEAPASRVAQYVDEVLLDGAYEVLEEVTP